MVLGRVFWQLEIPQPVVDYQKDVAASGDWSDARDHVQVGRNQHRARTELEGRLQPSVVLKDHRPKSASGALGKQRIGIIPGGMRRGVGEKRMKHFLIQAFEVVHIFLR
ncbi:hypothetical protein N7488_008953 [Penicillium malachiteum]|nr:hypothetical protein N7488_008953 [Penicillium malachiteum]